MYTPGPSRVPVGVSSAFGCPTVHMSDTPRPPHSRPTASPSRSHEGADWEAVARYLAGESSADEADAVRRWLAEHPADEAFVGAVRRAFPADGAEAVSNVDVERALAGVRGRIAREGERPRGRPALNIEPGSAGRSRRLAEAIARREPPAAAPRWPIAALAAAVMVLVAALFIWRPRSAAMVAGTPPGAREFVTGVGQRDSVLLGDGTRVVLGPGSRLVVAAGYGAARRDVELRGDGYFEVRHDAARPFTVHVGTVDVRDVGTTFAVHADSARDVRVVVTSGSVRVQSQGEGVNLRAGDVATLQPDGTIRAAAGAATADDLAWTRGRLVFREASMDEVRVELQRWYGVHLTVRDSTLAARHLTASFSGEPVGRVLDVIALALGANVEQRADTAVLSVRTGSAAR